MVTKDLHVHTTFSDGKNAPEEMVQAAIKLGMTTIGFSDHSYTAFDKSYCMSKENIPVYKACISELKEKYADRIEILLGIEQDYYSEEPVTDYDYVIGSVHYVRIPDASPAANVPGCISFNGHIYIPVDESSDIIKNAVKAYFGNDIYAFFRAYYETVAGVTEKTGADIIGHFDLIEKFNEGCALFDNKNEAYVSDRKKSADALIAGGNIFEINTGAISRGYRSFPYPDRKILEYIKAKVPGRLILSSDSHSKDTLLYDFEKYERFLKTS